MSEPWTVKHRPKTTSEIVGNKPAIEKLTQWLDSWSKGKPGKKAALLYGPPGVGKTVVSEAVARERGWDLVEINASDQRSGEILSRTAGLASTQSTLGGKGRLVLLDEVDGINLRQDTGAVTTIVQIIRESKTPIVLTANDPWDPKIRPLREACLQVELKRLGLRDGVPLLKQVLAKEGLAADEEALRTLIQKNNGDLRSTLNDLQVLTRKGKILGVREVSWLAYRDRTESIFEVLRIVFNSQTVAAARRATNISDVDNDMLFQWILENTPYQVPKAQELSEAMEALAEADLFFARIRKTQSWHLLSYALELMTAGVAVAKKTSPQGWTPMKFPQRISTMSRTRAVRAQRLALGAAIGTKSHVSARRAVQLYLPLIQFLFEHDRIKFDRVGDWLEAKDELAGFLEAEQPVEANDSS
jgi:replication factor C large subunit